MGLRRLRRGAQMQTSLEALLTMGLFFGGEGRTCEEDVSGTRKKSQDRAERMGNFFLDRKKILCC